MKLYSVNYKGDLTNYEWSIVTIHKTLENAEKAKQHYINNCDKNDIDCEYIIYVIDTDIDSDIIYDYENIDVNND